VRSGLRISVGYQFLHTRWLYSTLPTAGARLHTADCLFVFLIKDGHWKLTFCTVEVQHELILRLNVKGIARIDLKYIANWLRWHAVVLRWLAHEELIRLFLTLRDRRSCEKIRILCASEQLGTYIFVIQCFAAVWAEPAGDPAPLLIPTTVRN